MIQDLGIINFKDSLLQISTPIFILSLLSTIVSLIVIVVVIYIIRVSKNKNSENEESLKIPADLEELFLLLRNWDLDKYKTLLSSFFLIDEYTILDILISSLKEDKMSLIQTDEGMTIVGDGGWKNKNQITELSGLSTRKIYDKNGIIERLVKLGLLEVRESPTDWGRQTHQYRANPSHPLIRAMFSAQLNE